MAQPLFHADLDELLRCARASKISPTSDAYCVVEQALMAATAYIQSQAGIAETARLSAVADACPATTEDELSRLNFKLAESRIFLAELMCALPYLATDGSSYAFEEYDKNSLFRTMTPTEIQEQVKKLREAADQNLVDGGVDGTANSLIAIQLGGDKCRPSLFAFPALGTTIHEGLHYNRYGYHYPPV